MIDHTETCRAMRLQMEDLTQTQLVQMQIPEHLANHVRSCATCKTHLDQQLTLAAQVDLWTVPAPQIHIGTGVMTQIAQLEHDKQADTSSFWTQCMGALRIRMEIPTSLAAMVLCLLAVSVVFNLSHLDGPNTTAKHTPDPANNAPSQNIQRVQHANTLDHILPATHGLNTNQPWFSQSQLPASTMVIIIGAPPFPWTDSVPQPSHSQSQSL